MVTNGHKRTPIDTLGWKDGWKASRARLQTVVFFILAAVLVVRQAPPSGHGPVTFPLVVYAGGIYLLYRIGRFIFEDRTGSPLTRARGAQAPARELPPEP